MAATDPSIASAFRSCYAELVEALVEPNVLAQQLYSNNIISKETREKVNSGDSRSSRSNTVIDAVEAALGACREDTSKVSMILSILEKHPPLGDVIAKVRRDGSRE